MQEVSMSSIDQRQDACNDGFVQPAIFRFISSEQSGSILGTIDWLGDKKVCTCLHFTVDVLDLRFDIGWAQVQRRANEETCWLPDTRPRMVHAGVKALLDHFYQTGRYKVVIVHRFWIIA